MEETLEELKKNIKEEEEGHIMIGGDYNARTGKEGGPIVYGVEKKGKQGSQKIT